MSIISLVLGSFHVSLIAAAASLMNANAGTLGSLIKNPAEAEKEIIATMENFGTALAGLDYASMEQKLTEDVEIHSSNLKGSYTNRHEFLEAFKKKREPEKLTTRITVYPVRAEVSVLNDEEAVFRSAWDVEVRGVDMGATIKSEVWRGKGTSEYKLRKENGLRKIYFWKTVSD